MARRCAAATARGVQWGCGTDLHPRGDRREGVLIERDGAGAAAFAVAHGDPPACRTADRFAQANVARSAALVDVADEQFGGFGAPQAGGAEQMQQRKVALPLAGAAVGHLQQQRELVMGECARFSARHARRAHGLNRGVGTDRVGEATQRGEVAAAGHPECTVAERDALRAAEADRPTGDAVRRRLDLRDRCAVTVRARRRYR